MPAITIVHIFIFAFISLLLASCWQLPTGFRNVHSKLWLSIESNKVSNRVTKSAQFHSSWNSFSVIVMFSIESVAIYHIFFWFSLFHRARSSFSSLPFHYICFALCFLHRSSTKLSLRVLFIQTEINTNQKNWNCLR